MLITSCRLIVRADFESRDRGDSPAVSTGADALPSAQPPIITDDADEQEQDGSHESSSSSDSDDSSESSDR